MKSQPIIKINFFVAFFDYFNKADFETSIIRKLKSLPNVKAAYAVESQNNAGIQFADNLCSVIRLHKTGADEYGFFPLIEKWVKEV